MLKTFGSCSNNFSNIDYVLLDEAQDTNDVTLSILMKKFPNARKIIVGDKHQQIYSFRGSVNAMDKISSDYSASLTTTFRCNKHIVDYANYILNNFLFEKNCIKSDPKVPDRGDTCIISRTNSTLIKHINRLNDFKLIREPDEIFRSALAVYYYKRKMYNQIHPEYKWLMNTTSLETYLAESEDKELQGAVKINKDYPNLLDIYEKAKLNNSPESKNILTTAHTSKGLEFGKVIIENDFDNLTEISNKNWDKNPDEKISELNLLYVAITRSISEVEDINKYDCNGVINDIRIRLGNITKEELQNEMFKNINGNEEDLKNIQIDKKEELPQQCIKELDLKDL